MNTKLVCLLAFLALITMESVADARQRPNILFIMTDQQSAQAMSSRMGDQYLHTPAMDSLAKSGMVFSRAYVPNPLCMPARNSIFTGRYPHQTGVTQNSRGSMDPSKFTCLGARFRRAGYQTAYFGKWHLVFKSRKVAQHGFEIISDVKRVKFWDKQIASSAIRFLSQQHDKPFFAVVSFHNPHDVCELARGEPLPGGEIGTPPAAEHCPPAPKNLAPPQDETDSIALLRKGYHASRMFPVAEFSVDRWRQQRWGYYRLIEKVDREIGLVLNALREGGHEEETVVVFSSDHGDCAGAHRFNQKTVFYDESAQVPLIISWKGQTKPGVSKLLVNTGVDLLPTFCEFGQLAPPSGYPGRSLRSVAMGRAPSSWRTHIVVQNHMNQAGLVAGFRPQMQGRMVRTNRFKYCVYEYGERRESLVDMQQDSLETTNLAQRTEYREVLHQHRKLLQEFGEQQDDALVAKLLADEVGPRPFATIEEQ